MSTVLPSSEFEITGSNAAELFTMKFHWGDGNHYHFRLAQLEADTAQKQLLLAIPPRQPGDQPWWAEHYSDARRIRDRELFA
jgi:hypothetical protein